MEKEQKYYELYYSKEKYEMKIIPLRKIFDRQKDKIVPDMIYRYNDCYYFCTSRKMLRKFAVEMLNSWKDELNSIKI